MLRLTSWIKILSKRHFPLHHMKGDKLMDLINPGLRAAGSQGHRRHPVLRGPEQLGGHPQRTPEVTRRFLTSHLSRKQRCLVPTSQETHLRLASHLSPSPSSSETS